MRPKCRGTLNGGDAGESAPLCSEGREAGEPAGSCERAAAEGAMTFALTFVAPSGPLLWTVTVAVASPAVVVAASAVRPAAMSAVGPTISVVALPVLFDRSGSPVKLT